MTAQIHDKITIHEKVFLVVGVYGGELFTPQSIGIIPFPVITSCWRGYVCHYKVRDDELILDELQISINFNPLPGSEQALAPQVAPVINGVRPTGKSPSFNTTYENLNLEIPFTGSIFAGDGFIQSLYVHMGFQPAWKYQTVFELILESGKVQAIGDISAEMEHVRSRMTEQADDAAPVRSKRHKVSSWIKKKLKRDD